MFTQALNIAQSSGIQDLGSVRHICRRDFDERQTFLFRAQSPVIEYLSLLIENKLLLTTNRKGRVYAGFGRLSRMEPVIERYLRIADVSERVYVFGEADWKPPRHPNMRLIELERAGQAAEELFVIADSPSFRVALVATEEESAEAHAPETRLFRAIKSSDAAIVAQLSTLAEDLIDNSLAA